MSGDDDLFINEVARAKNTGLPWRIRGSYMTTQRNAATWVTWLHRKRRHYTTARFYRVRPSDIADACCQLARTSAFWATAVLWLHHNACIGAIVRFHWLGRGAVLIFLPDGPCLPLRKPGRRCALVWFAMPLEWLFLLLDPLLYTSTILVKPKRWK
jgi:hypothetical protein